MLRRLSIWVVVVALLAFASLLYAEDTVFAKSGADKTWRDVKSVAAGKKAGFKNYIGKDGKKKLAITAEELGRKNGESMNEAYNRYEKKTPRKTASSTSKPKNDGSIRRALLETEAADSAAEAVAEVDEVATEQAAEATDEAVEVVEATDGAAEAAGLEIAPESIAAESPWSPVQLSVWDTVQIFDSETSIYGLRYSLIRGVNHDVFGLGLSSFANVATGDVLGAQFSLAHNRVDGDFGGIQFSGYNAVSGNFYGLQAAGVNSTTAKFIGLQTALLNDSEGSNVGVQFAGLNLSSGEVSGVQLGIFGNDTRGGKMRGLQLALMAVFADEATGVQISPFANVMTKGTGVQIGGLFNVAEDMTGLQIGLLNFNKNGLLPFFPFFNVGI